MLIVDRTARFAASFLLPFYDSLKDDSEPDLPPGAPPTLKYEGPWFTTQIVISFSLGLFSFLVFSYCRTRWPVLFAPRTKLKGFSPHEAHAHNAFFGWIMPTLRISEFTVLQIVGLDAAVLLNFFKMGFYLFSCCSIFAIMVLMPINWKNNIGLDDNPDGEDDGTGWFLVPEQTPPARAPGWLDLISDANSYLSIHLFFTYLFTILALRFIYSNYRRFVRSRQLFTLELVHSVPARTVMVSRLPPHLQGERALAEYFENMNLSVESVNVCRDVATLKYLLDERTKALLLLEKTWVKYVGNPSTFHHNDAIQPLIDVEQSSSDVQAGRLINPNKKRPTVRPGWFSAKVDAIEHHEKRFQEADDKVKQWRRSGKFKSSHTAFVTFEKMSSAQVAIQTAHAPHPNQCVTLAAPEPRDIIWGNMSLSIGSSAARELIALPAMSILLFFWIFPITGLAGLLSYNEIQKALPWLASLIERNEKIRALVQNSLPSVAMISLNALAPFMLEGLTYVEGHRARSWIEYSLMKKYFLFLLINVVFIFLLATTYIQLLRDLANSPAKIPEKIAQALQKGTARHFFLSYVILQAFGIMPLQLLNLGVILPQMVYRIFITRTPRDYAELNAPPMINYGVVYPQSILIFVVTMLYSVVQPLILVFGALYFGIAYVVYKYKLLFVFYKPYESQGQAWPITFVRLIWGILIFLVFMTGIFFLKKSVILGLLVVPLMLGTAIWAWYVHHALVPLSEHVALSSVFEVERGEDSADVMQLRAGHPVTWSQSNLSKRRYAQNDETLYVAPEDARTDYSQPPMANFYSGVLNTGKRRYGHPALTGVLPAPWLPLKNGQTLSNGTGDGTIPTSDSGQAVVLTLRKRYSTVRRGQPPRSKSSVAGLAGSSSSTHSPIRATLAADNPWQDSPRPDQQNRSQTTPLTLHHRLSFDPASGIINLPDDDEWLGAEGDDEPASSDEDEDYGTVTPRAVRGIEPSSNGEVPTSLPSDSPLLSSPARRRRTHSTYYHHPERRLSRVVPGAFHVDQSD